MDGSAMAVGGLVVGALLAGLGVWLWSQRQIKILADRIVHLEQARHQAMDQNTHARRQLEHLQKETGELRHLLARSGAAVPTPKPLPPDPVQERLEEQKAEASGFAATQLIQR